MCDESWQVGDDSSLSLWIDMHRSVSMQRVVAYVGRLVALAMECSDDLSGYATSRGRMGITRRFLTWLSYDSFLSLRACLARSLHFF